MGKDTVLLSHTAEAKLRDLEVEAVRTAPITPGVVEALQAFRDTDRTVTIVSNNSQASVLSFLAVHDLGGLVTGVCSRQHPEPALLKPNPFLLRRAIVERDAVEHECVMIGDSPSDLLAGSAVGVPVVGFANKPSKESLLRDTNPPPKAVIASMVELVGAGLEPPGGRDLGQLDSIDTRTSSHRSRTARRIAM